MGVLKANRCHVKKKSRNRGVFPGRVLKDTTVILEQKKTTVQSLK